MITLKTKEQIDIMSEANNIVHSILDYAKNTIEVGMTSAELDKLMEEQISTYDATSAFKGYGGFPSVSCISVNNGVVHGISDNREFKEGDMIGIDFGVFHKGWAGDSAVTIILGKANNSEDIKLVSETRRSLYEGIKELVPGNRLHDISRVINNVARLNGYGNVRGFSGHGIGKKLHESPSVYNYIEPREPNVRLQEGMVLALEPMFSLGDAKVKVNDDKWTVVTIDKANTAHWEVSVAITKDGPRILGYYDR